MCYIAHMVNATDVIQTTRWRPSLSTVSLPVVTSDLSIASRRGRSFSNTSASEGTTRETARASRTTVRLDRKTRAIVAEIAMMTIRCSGADAFKDSGRRCGHRPDYLSTHGPPLPLVPPLALFRAYELLVSVFKMYV